MIDVPHGGVVQDVFAMLEPADHSAKVIILPTSEELDRLNDLTCFPEELSGRLDSA